MDKTKIYNTDEINDALIEDMLNDVALILEEKGYNPVNQIVGYLLSGDPGYISSYKEARNKITKFDRTKVLEVLVKRYIKK